MKCTKCGSEVTTAAKYCANCGTPTHTAKPEVAAKPELEKPKPSRSLTVWLVIIGIALVGTYASMFIPALIGQKPTTNPPTGLYVMVWTSLFFYLAWKYRSQKGWHGALIGAGIGFLVYTGAIMVAVSNKTAAKDKAGAEHIVDMIEEFYTETQKVNPDGTPFLIDKTFAPSEDATGSMAVMQQFVADIANESAAMNNDYLGELQSIGWNALLDEDHLLSDPTFKNSRRIIVKARLVTDKYEKRTMEIITNARDRIQYLKLSETDKRAIEDGYKRGFEGSTDLREKMWELERSQIDEMEKIIDMLADEPGTWEVEEGQFLFERDQQIDQFNKHMANIDKFYADQIELQKLTVQKQRQRLEELF